MALIMLSDVASRINIVDAIDYLSDIDFNYIVLAADNNSFLQLLAEMNACRHYHINVNIVASLLIELFNCLRRFLQHHCKIDSMHLINSATNYSQCKCDIGLEMTVRINFLIGYFCSH